MKDRVLHHNPAAALGTGFALKLTPAMFLPLVFLLAARRRPIVYSAIAFVVAATAPFLPHLVRGGRGLLSILTYHAKDAARWLAGK